MGGGGTILKPVAGAVGRSRDSLSIPRPPTTTTSTNLPSHHLSSSHLNLPVSANFSASLRPTCTKCTCFGETSTKIQDKTAMGSSYDHVFGPVPSRIEVEKAMADLQKPSCNKCSCVGERCTKIMEYVDGREDKRASRSYNDSVFGPVPSRIEVEKAISDLQRFMHGLSKSGSDYDWVQQMMCPYDPRMPQSFGYGTLYNAVQLLQTEPSVQKMVISISSDKVVWEAILNNKAVQDLQESLYTAKEERVRPQSSNEESDLAAVILKWILGITKAKVMELIGKFGLLVNDMFQLAEKEKPTSELDDLLEEKLGSSFLLSIVILLIVVVTRIHGV